MIEKELEKYINAAFCREKAGIEEITIEDLKQAFQDGYDKANEWHYPSRGELPECDEKTRLIFYVTCYYGDITRKRLVLGYYQKSFINDDIKLFTEKSKGYEAEHLPKDVIAWKVVELPEEIE